jgi:tetratricopeptide (TPR) repeat protein
MLHERFGLPYLVSVHSRTWLAASLVELGLFKDAIEQAKDAMQIAESSNHGSSLVSAHMGLGRAYLRRSDLARAVPVLERGVELARLWKMRLVLPFLTDSLGLAYALAGRTAEAFPLLQEALDLHVAMRGTTTQSARLVSLAQGHLLAGNPAEAEPAARRALELAERHGERGYLAYAHGTLGEAFLALGSPSYHRAEQHWLAAAALSRDLEMRPLTARCHLGLGTLSRLLGRPDAADRLASAVALFTEMEMPLWLARAEAERGRLA